MSYGFSNTHFFYNNNLIKNTSVDIIKPESIAVYEVFRIIGGIPLFAEDHIERLHSSMLLVGIYDFSITQQVFSNKVKELCTANNKQFGNIELCVSKPNNSTIDCYIGFIQHKYPNPLNYIEGVITLLMQNERENPKTKVKHTLARLKANEFLNKNNNVFEAVFVNSKGNITEGSRSNVFFIKDKVVYTAPQEIVLSGITRKYAIKALLNQNIDIIEKPVHKSGLSNMDAAFLCGTSPGIIPIKQIDNYKFNANNLILRNTILEFNSIVEKYMARKS